MARKPKTSETSEPAKAKRLTNLNLSSVSVRDKLPVRESPYWHKLDKGCHIGIRKMTLNSEIWWARFNIPGTTDSPKESLGEFGHLPRNERFGAAKKAAEAWFKTLGRVGRVKPTTVKEACALYVAHKLETEGSEPASDIEGRFRRWIDDAPIGKIPLAKLTRSDIEEWRKAMVNTPVKVNRGDGDKPLTRPRSMQTANRDLTPLRAALNYAHGKDLVASDKAWAEELKPLVKRKRNKKKVEAEADGANDDLEDDLVEEGEYEDENEEYSRVGHHNIELNLKQRTALLAAASEELRPLLLAMSLLPVRPGAMSRLRVRQLNIEKSTLKIGRDKAGSGRTLPLPPTTLAAFEAIADGKPENALLFPRANGKRWDKDSWKKPVKAAVIAAGLPMETTLYTVRHSVITDLVEGGLDVGNIAKLAGTSILMIDKHYFKLRRERATAALAALQIVLQPPPTVPFDYGDENLI